MLGTFTEKVEKASDRVEWVGSPCGKMQPKERACGGILDKKRQNKPIFVNKNKCRKSVPKKAMYSPQSKRLSSLNIETWL